MQRKLKRFAREQFSHGIRIETIVIRHDKTCNSSTDFLKSRRPYTIN